MLLTECNIRKQNSGKVNFKKFKQKIKREGANLKNYVILLRARLLQHLLFRCRKTLETKFCDFILYSVED